MSSGMMHKAEENIRLKQRAHRNRRRPSLDLRISQSEHFNGIPSMSGVSQVPLLRTRRQLTTTKSLRSNSQSSINQFHQLTVQLLQYVGQAR